MDHFLHGVVTKPAYKYIDQYKKEIINKYG